MSTEIDRIAPKPLSVIQRAELVFAATKSEDELKALAKASETIVTITNQAGYDQCHSARMALKNERLYIARIGEEGREDAVQTSKAIIARQKVLIAITQPEENRLNTIQDAWDKRIEDEKEAKIKAEIARVAEIQRRIDGIRNWAVNAANQPSILVGQMLQQANDYQIDPAVFEEFVTQATDALMVSRAALEGLLAQRKAHEAAEEQLRKDREELAKHRAEQAARDNAAAEAKAKADAEAKAERDRQEAAAKAERDAEAKKQAEANRLERERIAKEAADAKAIRDADAKKIADDAAALAAAQAKFAADQEAARVAALPKPEPVSAKVRTVTRPTAEQIVAVVANHWSVSTAMAEKWLRNPKWEEEKAA